ncbi:male accessory gland serine protease inhibitor-like [Drosophila santomea]|uniref:male accessory gland serine protease inhibitor-like n=1 Tax=Drosophila santomea TaxID=129105 RepID=UPI0019538B9A|nr:male accessory gland serine protease inhibitor-like [Drosophila santomea]
MKMLILLFVFIALASNSMALKNEICGLPHSQIGSDKYWCLALIPNWSYDSNKKECVKFSYGGCGGNANRFFTKELCEKMCRE